MRHSLRVTHEFPCHEASLRRRFRGAPGDWLPVPAQAGDAAGEWDTYVGTERLGVLVRVVVGPPADGGAETRRLLRWEPRPGPVLERWLPPFDGDIGLEVDGRGAATLFLDGAYRPPGGAVGWLLDRAALGRLAHRSGRVFLREVAQRLRFADARAATNPR